MVTTPQDLALSDASRALEMFASVRVPVLGIVENMSVFQCQHCGKMTHLFGEQGGDKLAERYNTPVLGHIPLHISLGKDMDEGYPTVVRNPNELIAQQFSSIAQSLVENLNLLAAEDSLQSPEIVILED